MDIRQFFVISSAIGSFIFDKAVLEIKNLRARVRLKGPQTK
jgi:hypothetical protein